MDALPMAPSCSLDQAGLHRQLERYARAGTGARLASRDRQRLVIDLDERVDLELVGELVAVERECCPFFDLRWQPHTRRLAVSVSSSEYEPALAAIAFALGVEAPAPHEC